jgi:hypothetical protein
LSGFVVFLQQEENRRNPNTIRHFVITARNLLEYHDIEISPRKFKIRVRLPKPVVAAAAMTRLRKMEEQKQETKTS